MNHRVVSRRKNRKRKEMKKSYKDEKKDKKKNALTDVVIYTFSILYKAFINNIQFIMITLCLFTA